MKRMTPGRLAELRDYVRLLHGTACGPEARELLQELDLVTGERDEELAKKRAATARVSAIAAEAKRVGFDECLGAVKAAVDRIVEGVPARKWDDAGPYLEKVVDAVRGLQQAPTCKLCGKPRLPVQVFCGAACSARWEAGARPAANMVDP